MASGRLHGSSRYEESYPPRQFIHRSYSQDDDAQTSNEASYNLAVPYDEASYQPSMYAPPPAPQAQANSGRNPPGSAAQARSAINAPSTLPPAPTHVNPHFSPSPFTPPYLPPAQPSPMLHSHSPPGYVTVFPNSSNQPQDRDEASHHPQPGPSGGQLATSSVAPHGQQPRPFSPGSTIRPQPPPLGIESFSNSDQRRYSRPSELHHSPTSPTSPSTSTRFRNSAVPSTGSTHYERFSDDTSTDNSHAPKESAVARNPESFRRGRTHPKVQPLDWSKLPRPWGKNKANAKPLIPSTHREGQQMDIGAFCNTYSLPGTILLLFHDNAITGTHAFSYLTGTDLTEMGFKKGEIIDLRVAINVWAPPKESF